jgi:UDP-glucuronate decarboxylase
VHAASIASPTFYRLHPIETMDANVNGLRHLLDACVSLARDGRPVERLLFFSTSEIYGDPPAEQIPTPEDYRGNVSCTGPRACYDESKRYGETLCVNFAQCFNLPITIARPFNNYGPGLRLSDRRLVPDFARDVLNGHDIVMYSDGTPSRTFCYVADAVVGFYKILIKGGIARPYNIGASAPEVSVRQLADEMVGVAAAHFGYRGSVVRATSGDRNYLVDNPVRRCPLLTRAQHELGYEATISLREGLYRSLLWYRDHAGDER